MVQDNQDGPKMAQDGPTRSYTREKGEERERKPEHLSAALGPWGARARGLILLKKHPRRRCGIYYALGQRPGEFAMAVQKILDWDQVEDMKCDSAEELISGIICMASTYGVSCPSKAELSAYMPVLVRLSLACSNVCTCTQTCTHSRSSF